MEFKYKKSTVHRFYELEIKEIHKVLTSIGMSECDALSLIQKNLGIPDKFMLDVKAFLNNSEISKEDYIRYFLAAEILHHRIAKLMYESTHTVLKVRRDIQSHESQTYLHDLFNAYPSVGENIERFTEPLHLFKGNYLGQSRHFLLKHRR